MSWTCWLLYVFPYNSIHTGETVTRQNSIIIWQRGNEWKWREIYYICIRISWNIRQSIRFLPESIKVLPIIRTRLGFKTQLVKRCLFARDWETVRWIFCGHKSEWHSMENEQVSLTGNIRIQFFSFFYNFNGFSNLG